MDAAPSFSMPNLGSGSYSPGCNGRTYTKNNGSYQALYTTVAYTDPIPLPGSSAGFLPNYAYNNVTWYNTYDPLEHGGFGYKTSPQLPFRSQSVEMMPARATAEPCTDPNNLTTRWATILRESFGIEPKGQGRVYQKSYPDYYDQLPYPRGYRVPKFSKFRGEDGKTTLEHVGQFILQCGEASANDALKLRMFPLFLSGTSFT
jgi:hypothetical protein